MRGYSGMIGLFIAALCLASVQSQQADCDSTQLTAIEKCYSTYLAGYNFTMTDTLPYYWDFHTYRMQMLDQQGLKVQSYICQLANALLSCVQPYQCLAGAGPYAQMGAGNATLAQDWYIDLLVSQYQCGPGYNIGNQEFYCLAYAREYHQALLDDCVNQMAINISQGGDVCKAEQQMMNCQSLIFSNTCDFNAGVYMCNVNWAGINATDMTCSNMGLLSCPPPRRVQGMLQTRLAKKPDNQIITGDFYDFFENFKQLLQVKYSH
ncbi:hypothetical protein WR25_17834 [Diploscapter pachys]|uniref:DUF19 domain-containing protein n=1 Tax=Diploscapter pachys TaxID=2018661 RepID=A0A2A2KYX8_9BILA|nr:hypothetical protein WR25_17834 [Diploscapter pachys]